MGIWVSVLLFTMLGLSFGVTNSKILTNDFPIIPTTPEVTGGDIELLPVGTVTEYFVAPSYSITDPNLLPPELPEAPGGTKWIMVVASIGNQSDFDVVLQPQHVTVIDQYGERFQAEIPDSFTEPPLTNGELAPNTTLLGIARFAVPVESILQEIEWCPNGNCEVAVTAPLN